MNLLKKSIGWVILLGLIAGAYIYPVTKQASPVLGGAFNPIQAQKFTLNGAGVTSSATSIGVNSLLLPDAATKITMSMFGSIGYATIEPGTSKEENISFTGITQNANGSASLTGASRGLAFTTPYAASTTLAYAHAGGSYIIFSNSAPFYSQFGILGNAQTWTGIDTFGSTTPPRLDAVAAQGTGTYIATTSEFASVAYVNTVALTSAPNGTTAVKGVYQTATGLQAASSTALGSTGAQLVLGNGIATDTPSVPQSVSGSHVIMSNILGFLNQAWLDLTANFAWTGTHTFTGTNGKIGIGTTSPYAALSVVGQSVFSYFTATSTTASSTVYNFVASNNASTTNLTVSGSCTGCSSPTIVTGTPVTTGTTAGNIGSGSASCTGSKIAVGGGGNATTPNNGALLNSYPSSSQTWSVSYIVWTNGSATTFTPYVVCVNP